MSHPSLGSDLIQRFTRSPARSKSAQTVAVIPPTPPSLQKRRRRPSTGDDAARDPDYASSIEPDDVLPPTPTSGRKRKAVAKKEEEEEGLASPSKKSKGKKQQQSPKKYAPPEVYAHLKGLTDALTYHNHLVFCGINPGKKSAETGCAYAHPSNHFWKALGESGLTEGRLHPRASSDGTMPSQYDYGMTNLVDRPTSQESELNNAEKRFAVPALLAKIAHFHPRMVTFIGKSIFDQIYYVLKPETRWVVEESEEALQGLTPAKRRMRVDQRKNQRVPKGVRARSGLFPLRLVHANGDKTYLYVQFSTSGLCRDAQVEIFRHVKTLVEFIRAGDFAAIDAMHDDVDWLELDLATYLEAHPPAEVPPALKASLELQQVKDEAKPVGVMGVQAKEEEEIV